MKSLKTLIIVIALFIIPLTAIAQKVYIQKFPKFPVNINQVEVNTFLEKLMALEDEIRQLSDLYESENRSAAENIDPNTVAAMYSQTNVKNIMNMQKKMEEMQTNQSKLSSLNEKYNDKNENIKSVFNEDFNTYLEKYNEYTAECFGEGGSAELCNSLRSKLGEYGKQILNKYWFDEKSAEYRKYLYAIKEEMQSLHIVCTVQSLESAESTGGIKFPHKEDLAELNFTLDYISFIKNAWSIESRLWPL